MWTNLDGVRTGGLFSLPYPHIMIHSQWFFLFLVAGCLGVLSSLVILCHASLKVVQPKPHPLTNIENANTVMVHVYWIFLQSNPPMWVFSVRKGCLQNHPVFGAGGSSQALEADRFEFRLAHLLMASVTLYALHELYSYIFILYFLICNTSLLHALQGSYEEWIHTQWTIQHVPMVSL